MFNFKLYFPFIFLMAGLSLFFHFQWLPSHVKNERQYLIEQEKKYLSLLGVALAPSILSSDLAEIKGTLDQILKSREAVELIELYSKDGARLYPLFDANHQKTKWNFKMNLAVKQSGVEYGRLVAVIGIERLLERKLRKIKELEKLLFYVFVLFLVVGIYFQYRWIRKPLQSLMFAAHEVAKGKYDMRLPTNLNNDLSEFVSAFEEMRFILKCRACEISRQNEIQSAVQKVQSFFIGSHNTYAAFNEVLQIVLKITKSKIGFVGEIEYDQSRNPILNTYALSNIAWDVESRLAYEKSINGSITFSNINTLFGNVMLTGKPVISNDPQTDHRSGGIPPGHPALDNFLGVPLYNRQSRLMGMIGLANSSESYSEELYDELDILWLAIGNLIDTHSEQVLRAKSEQNLLAVVNNAVEGIITIDAHGIIETFNPAAEKMFGYTENELIGCNIKMLMPDEYARQHDRYLSSYLGGGKAKVIGIGREVIGLRKNGETFPMELSVAEVRTGNTPRFTGIVRDITERKEKEQEIINTREQLHVANLQLEELVRTDGLTKVSNRRHFDEKLAEEFNRASRQQIPITLIIFDVDHFKKFNDSYGHAEGDKCLIELAQTTKSLFQRTGEVVARYGGEEFAIILPYTDCDTGKKMAEVLLENIRDLQIKHDASTTADIVTISVGVSCVVPTRDKKIKDLIHNADSALYAAKESGRNQVVVHAYN